VDTVHECERQTDGQTDRITITTHKSVQRRASRGKNSPKIAEPLDELGRVVLVESHVGEVNFQHS